MSEQITISKIYDTIKNKNFIQEMWWDLISDIHNKPSYQRIKRMVVACINDTMNEICVEPCTEAERIKRRSKISEISIMTYTVDTVISEVLFKKLQNEFPLLIAKIIEELKRENKIPENSFANLTNTLSGKVENTFSSIAEKVNNDMKDNKSRQNTSKAVSLMLKTPKSSLSVGEDANHSTVRRRGRPKKQNSHLKVVPMQDECSSQLPLRKRGRPANSRKKKMKKVYNISKENPGQNNKTESDENKESDTESDVSVGRRSFVSVSSVHTSELSSFEDAISVCSDEENGHKRIVPLKLANDMYLRGKLSQIYEFGKKVDIPKKPAKASHKSAVKNSASINPSSSSRKLPHRVRKRNSKYNLETMYCENEFFSSNLQKDISVQSPQKLKKGRISHNDKSESSTETSYSPVSRRIDVINANPANQCSTPAKNSATMGHDALDKSSSKRYNPSDLYKPRNSFGSRESLPVSLFSN